MVCTPEQSEDDRENRLKMCQRTRISLSQCGLKEVPKVLLDNTTVTELILSHNHLTFLPRDLGRRKLPQLRLLDVSWNQLTASKLLLLPESEHLVLNAIGNPLGDEVGAVAYKAGPTKEVLPKFRNLTLTHTIHGVGSPKDKDKLLRREIFPYFSSRQSHCRWWHRRQGGR